MKELRIVPHGGVVKPAFARGQGDTPGWAGKSTPDERRDGQGAGIRKRYAKNESAVGPALTLDLIKAVESDAIEFTGIAPDVRGLILFSGLIAAAVGIYCGGVVALPDLLKEDLTSVPELGLVGIALFFVYLGLYTLLRCMRLELFRPQDEPIIFDRKNRKVYRIFRETHPGLKGLLRPWPLRCAEYHWDLIDAEYNTTLSATGSTIITYHTLIFIVRRSETDPTIIDSFNLGNTMQMSEQSVPAVWEHVRRFMEENGPHLPLGEVLAKPKVPETLWQSLAAVGPFGSNYRVWWRKLDSLMILIHVLFPIFLPFFLFWGILNWLSYKTATKVSWPREVLDAIGAGTERAAARK